MFFINKITFRSLVMFLTLLLLSLNPINTDALAIIPDVLINGEIINGELITGNFRLAYIQQSIIHSGFDFHSFIKLNLNDTLERVIGRELLYRNAGSMGFSVSDSDLQQHLKDKFIAFGGKDRLINFYESQKLDFNTYKRITMRTLVIKKYVDSVFSVNEITMLNAEKYYEDNLASFSEPEERVIDILQVDFPKDISIAPELVSLENHSRSINSTSALKDLAAIYKPRSSEGVIVKENYRIMKDSIKGGYFYERSAHLQNGECGFYTEFDNGNRRHNFIICLKEIKRGKVTPFDEIKDQLLSKLRIKTYNDKVKDVVEGLKGKSEIKILPANSE